ncbi:hypothetical protein Tco_0677638, partial [Tanacetum coccineum]
ERNLRLFGGNGRSEEEILQIVFESVRLRIIGLKIKVSSDVIKASEMIIPDHMYSAEQRGVWCSSLSLIDKWPYRADDRLTSRKLGLLKYGWCCSNLISLALGSLESFNLIVTSAGFLSLGSKVMIYLVFILFMDNTRRNDMVWHFLSFMSSCLRFPTYGDVLSYTDWSQCNLVIQRRLSTLAYMDSSSSSDEYAILRIRGLYELC